MSISDFFPAIVRFIISIFGLIYGVVCIVSGIKKQEKSFHWLSGFGSLIKSPLVNIVYGFMLVIIFSAAIIWYAAKW